MSNSDAVSQRAEPLRDYFVRLFEYDHWANRFVMEAMATIENLPGKPLDRMSHLIICQSDRLRKYCARGHLRTRRLEALHERCIFDRLRS